MGADQEGPRVCKMDCGLYPKGSGGPEERHGLLFILEKSLWLCCRRKGLGVAVSRMGDLP